MESIKIGTRGSQLAVWQANHIKSLIELKCNIKCSIKVISTMGDEDVTTPLPEIGDKGFFTAEIEEELSNGEIDIAVHSLKDLPTKLDPKFVIAAVPKRSSYRDVIVTNSHSSFKTFPVSPTIATGSLRRELQIKSLFNDTKIVDVRGNIITRLDKLKKYDWDGLVMAEAAIKRLGLDIDYLPLSKDDITPAAGQGALAVQINSVNSKLLKILDKINHKPSFDAVKIEREIVDKLEGGCKVPVGCLVRIFKNEINIDAYLSNPDGSKVIRIANSGKVKECKKLIEHTILAFHDEGADKIIESNRKLN